MWLLALMVCLPGVVGAESSTPGVGAQGNDAYARSLEHTQAKRFAEALKAAERVEEPLFRGQAELFARFGARDYLGGIAAAARTLEGRLDDLDQLGDSGRRGALYLMQQAASSALLTYGDAVAVDAWCDALEGALVTFGIEGAERAEWDVEIESLRDGARGRRDSIERRGEALRRAQATLGWGAGGLVLILLLLVLLPMPGRRSVA